jgi:hypothetical protein
MASNDLPYQIGIFKPLTGIAHGEDPVITGLGELRSGFLPLAASRVDCADKFKLVKPQAVDTHDDAHKSAPITNKCEATIAKKDPCWTMYTP